MSLEPVDDSRSAQLEAQLAEARDRAERAEAQLRGEAAIAAGVSAARPALDHDVHYALARACLWLVTLGTFGFLLISFPAYISIAHDDPPFGRSMDPTVQGVLMAVLVDIFMCPMGIAAVVALVGLRGRKRYGWVAGVISFGIGALFCTPIGVYGLFAFLRNDVRHAFYPPRAPFPPSVPLDVQPSGFTPPPGT